VSPPTGVTCTLSGVTWKCTSQDGTTDPMDLAPGAGLTFLVTIVGAVPGPAPLLVNADSTGVVAELSESNNTSTWLTLVMPPPGP
jgi:hypothetical protein